MVQSHFFRASMYVMWPFSISVDFRFTGTQTCHYLIYQWRTLGTLAHYARGLEMVLRIRSWEEIRLSKHRLALEFAWWCIKTEGGEWSSPPLLRNSLTGELLMPCLNRLHSQLQNFPLVHVSSASMSMSDELQEFHMDEEKVVALKRFISSDKFL